MNFHDVERLVLECDGLLRAGKISEVAERVSKLTSKVPRPARQTLAKICRRAGLIREGLRLLHPVVRAEAVSEGPAAAGELCEYSVLLSRNGSIPEALALLAQVDPKEAPEAWLYTAFCHITTWDYAEAAVLLERYLSSNVEDYAKIIARVNLLAAYLALEKVDEAGRLLRETIPLAEAAGASRLVGNCLEQRGHYHFLKGDLRAARADLQAALSIFAESDSYDRLLILKWHAILDATESGSAAPLLKFRKEAVAKKHWESVRELDLFAAKTEFKQKPFDHLYIGTPLAGYRQRLDRLIGREPSAAYVLGGPNVAACLDLSTGDVPGAESLTAGRKLHQVIASLTRDFYVPRNIGSLFAELYPDEFFNTESSPVKIRQILRRTRRWLEAQGFGAAITFSDGGYRVQLESGFGIRVPLVRPVVDPQQIWWEKLIRALGAKPSFTAAEACASLGLSRSAFLRLARWAAGRQLVVKEGYGNAFTYTVSKRGGDFANQKEKAA